MNRWNENHLLELERRLNGLREYALEQKKAGGNVPWALYLSDEAFPGLLSEMRRLQKIEQAVIEEALAAEAAGKIEQGETYG